MRVDYSWPDPQDRADKLAPVAEAIVQRIRQDNPTALCRELLSGLDRWEEWAVICILAARVDPNEEYDVQVGWVKYRDSLERKAPIVWAEDEVPIEAMDSAAINKLIAELASKKRSDDEIAELIGRGLTAGAVATRRRRMKVPAGLRRGDVRTARAEVA